MLTLQSETLHLGTGTQTLVLRPLTMNLGVEAEVGSTGVHQGQA